jgi:Uma2 family endonuclease
MRSATRTTRPLPGTVYDPLYPDSDGKPMSETDYHSIAIVHLKEALDDAFRALLDVYIAMNILLYYRRGDPRGRRGPDILVARGVVGKHARRSFRVWEEGVLPCTLFEITSEKTWRPDVGAKRREYARLNIPEYFVFDPEGQYIDPVLRGFQSVNGKSIEMGPAADGSLESAQLGLRLTPDGMMLRLRDLRTGELIRTRTEQREIDRQMLAQRDAEIARLRAELARRGKRR